MSPFKNTLYPYYAYLRLIKDIKILQVSGLKIFEVAVFTCCLDTRHCEHCKLPSHHDVTRLVDHYITTFGINEESCKMVKGQTKILVLNRNTNRRILNMKQLSQRLREVMFVGLEIVTMETMSVREQIQKVYCSDVLIGVHGAGLTW